jgi:hypothetical protein
MGIRLSQLSSSVLSRQSARPLQRAVRLTQPPSAQLKLVRQADRLTGKDILELALHFLSL